MRYNSILSLDLGTTFGWGYAQDGEILYSGREDIGNVGGHKELTYTRFWNWLQDYNGLLDAVVYEKVMAHFGGKDKKTGRPVTNTIAAHTYGALEGLLMMFCGWQERPVLLKGYHVGTIKKQFCGNGKATKKEMCEEAHRRGWLGGQVGTDKHHDEADARAMLYFFLEQQAAGMLLE